MFKNDNMRILGIGSQVRLSFVDMYCFCGRDPHPNYTDEGFVGFVTSILEAGDHEFGNYDLDIVHIGMELPEEGYAVYEVQDASGRKLHLVNHEIEVLRSSF